MMHEAEMCGSKEACETSWSSKLLRKTGRGGFWGSARKPGVMGQQEVGIGLKIRRVDRWTESNCLDFPTLAEDLAEVRSASQNFRFFKSARGLMRTFCGRPESLLSESMKIYQRCGLESHGFVTSDFRLANFKTNGFTWTSTVNFLDNGYTSSRQQPNHITCLEKNGDGIQGQDLGTGLIQNND